MSFPFRSFLLCIIISLGFYNFSFSQIVFKEPAYYNLEEADPSFLLQNDKLQIISLNGNWKIYTPDDDEKTKLKINVPSVFYGDGNIVYEKSFSATHKQIASSQLRLNFLGINYTADISLNNVIIYRHSGGELPIRIDLPKDILKSDKANIIKVTLAYKLDSQNTIPLKNKFLFPNNYGGIIRDVFIEVLPLVAIENFFTATEIVNGNVNLTSSIKVSNRLTKKNVDSLISNEQFFLKILLIDDAGNASVLSESPIQIKPNTEKSFTQKSIVQDIKFWSPENPYLYKIKFQVLSKDQILDEREVDYGIYSLRFTDDNLTLNGSNYQLNGVTYIPSFGEFGSLADYEKMERDIKTIKETGFNAVRFAKSIPHPYFLYLCGKYGLLSFIELPLNSIPENLSIDQNFRERCSNFIQNMNGSLGKYFAVAGVGLGGSYLSSSPEHRSLIEFLSSDVKQKFKGIVYASFCDAEINELKNLDMFGLEVLNKNINEVIQEVERLKTKLGESKVFISEATYIVNSGNTDGYLNPFSFEAQAKFYSDMIGYASTSNLSAYFINSMFDYRGDLSSVVSGYGSSKIYQAGILREDRRANSLTYKVISAKLKNLDKVTIPIGSRKDDSPMIFIVFGLALALMMGVLINSGKKFREDTSRALLRPYNFFADVRDQRIISGYHSAFLALIIILVSSLIAANLLHYLRNSVLFDKLLLSFGSEVVLSTITYLSWHPSAALFWLSVLFGLFLLDVIVLIKVFSFFVKTRVYFSSIFFTTIWAHLPLVLLIPLGIVLYRTLSAEIATTYIYYALFIYLIWIFYRLLKGISVIFDVNAGAVYFYSAIFLIVAIGAVVFFAELNNSFLENFLLTLKQFQLI